MKHLGRLATIIMLTINLITIGLLLFAAYSPNVDPELHPLRACMGLTFPVFLVLNSCFLVFWLIFRYRLALVPLIGFLLCASPIRTYMPINFRTSNVPEGSIKILSYNVMAFGDLRKTAGKNPVLDYLKESDADIICMQEYTVTPNRKYVTQDNIDKVLKAYPYKHIQQVGVKGSSNGLACYSKYPILRTRRVEYASNNNGSIVYEIAIGKDTVTLINNHLESNKLTALDKEVYEEILTVPEADKVKKGVWHLLQKLGDAQQIRATQARAVAEEVKKSRYPYVVVCGDFNDSPISYAHQTISQNLDDAFRTSGSGLGISYNQNKFYFRIDHILTSRNLKAYNCTVDRSIKSSDHYPIWTYVGKR
ncbi:endonuclease/exonuclease/phosphatase family protein [Bacteroides sp. 51]|uniref:endonuclease/exonuclease/phosphatase family protein n=1 Tax=Bacteroides sp. 51 TaxID=2302938 RepID=UPI0013D19623|nr:endonuclease/exonuclease/phosphatase family protein [Bacteroides sp. 51]NDV82116.1 endonuclease [Bacteroides sp. 51]